MTKPNRLPLSLLASALALAGCFSQEPKASLESAKARLAERDRNGAVIELKNTLQRDADNTEARFLLGRTLLELDELPTAEIELSKAAQQGFPGDQVVPLLASARYQLGQHQRVINDFDADNLQSPDAKAALLAVQAQAQLALRNLGESGKLNDEALRLNGQDSRALLNRISLSFNRGALDEALTQVDALLKAQPDLAEALAFKAQLLQATGGDRTQIRGLYERVAQLSPRSAGAHTSLVIDSLERKDIAQAKAQLEQARKALGKSPQIAYLAALIALAEDKLEVAREQATQLLRFNSPPSHYLRLGGIVAYRLGVLQDAERLLARALLEAPNDSSARLLLAAVQMQRGDASKAITTLEPLTQAKSPLPDALAALGQAYMMQNELAKAEAAFQRAVAANPGDIRAKASLAVTEVEKGRAESGFDVLNKLAIADKGSYADMALISAHMRRQEYPQALQGIERLEAKQGPRPNTLVLRGTIELAMGRREEARKAFEQTLKLERGHYVATASLATLDLADKRVDAAADRFQRLLSIDGNNLQAEMALIGVKAIAGAKPEEIEQLLRDCVKRHPAIPTPRLALVDHLARHGNKVASLTAAQEGAAAIPGDNQMVEALGLAQMRSGDLNQAAATFGKLVGNQGGSAQAQMRMAEVQIARKQFDAGLLSLKKARDLDPDYMPAQILLAKTYAQTGKLRELREHAMTLQKRRPRNALGYLFEGEAEAAAKNWQGASRAYQQGLQRAPGNTELAIKLTRSMRLAGQRAEGDRFASEWMNKHPKDATFIGSMADDLLTANKLEPALALYQRVLTVVPNNAAAANNAAWILHTLKRPGAEALAEKAVKAGPDSPLYLDTLATIQAASGKLEAALTNQRKALSMTPKSGALRLNLAKLLIAAGDTPAARQELLELSKLGAQFHSAAEVKSLLESVR